MYLKCFAFLALFLEIILGTYLCINTNEEKTVVNITNVQQLESPANPKIVQKEKKLEIPEEYSNENVIAKLEISKIELVTYVIGDTTDRTLAKSVTKLCGPEVNKPGNLCITGHNYIQDNMFYKLRKLEIGDELSLTDLYENTYIYKIYAVKEIMPDDTSVLSQETYGEREVTLITCTIGAKKRLVVKAMEVYD